MNHGELQGYLNQGQMPPLGQPIQVLRGVEFMPQREAAALTGDLYGEEIRVDFVQRLRDVRPFDSVAALISQMKDDVEEARRVLGGSSPTG